MAELSQDQLDVVDAFGNFLSDPNYKEMCILGGPGNGKTFLTKYLIEYAETYLKNQRGLLGEAANPLCLPESTPDIYVTSTTHKACGVLAKATGHDTQTIHSLLGVRPKPTYMGGLGGLLEGRNSKYFVPGSIIFIDEAGMVDSGLNSEDQKKLIWYIDKKLSKCKLVFIGDHKQVLAVNERNCPAFNRGAPKFVLTTQHRQPSQLINGLVVMNPIEKIVHQLRETVDTHVFPKIITDGEFLVQCTGNEFKAEIDKHFGPNSIGNNKIVNWTNETTDLYNNYARSLHTKSAAPVVGERFTSNKAMVIAGKLIIGSGDDITVLEVSKSKMRTPYKGVILHGYKVSFEAVDESIVSMFMPEDPTVSRTVMKQLRVDKLFTELDTAENTWLNLSPGYASTVQKAQGSTYDNVFIDLRDIGRNFDPESTARILLTAISRASKKVFFSGHMPDHYGGPNENH